MVPHDDERTNHGKALQPRVAVFKDKRRITAGTASITFCTQK
jgi:hypothetical protein